jgi:hypothetical protein
VGSQRLRSPAHRNHDGEAPKVDQLGGPVDVSNSDHRGRTQLSRVELNGERQLQHRDRSSKGQPALEDLNGEGKGRRIDYRLAFLACASARFDLVEAGIMTLDEALDDTFVEKFRAVAEITCRCEREMIDRWERSRRPSPPYRRAAS